MKSRIFRVMVFWVILAAGCGSFTTPLNTGDSVPQGKVLMIGKVIVDPHFADQRPGTPKSGKEEDRYFIMLGMNDDLKRSVNSIDEAIDPDLSMVFFYPVSPGTKYIRVGQVMVPSERSTIVGPGAVAPTWDVLRMPKNIKLTIPADARAVYIGTIIYTHNGKKVTKVTVRDEYKQAKREVAQMRFRGVSGRHVVKRLAVVLN